MGEMSIDRLIASVDSDENVASVMFMVFVVVGGKPSHAIG